jgi:hypothetical protein
MASFNLRLLIQRAYVVAMHSTIDEAWCCGARARLDGDDRLGIRELGPIRGKGPGRPGTGRFQCGFLPRQPGRMRGVAQSG